MYGSLSFAGKFGDKCSTKLMETAIKKEWMLQKLHLKK